MCEFSAIHMEHLCEMKNEMLDILCDIHDEMLPSSSFSAERNIISPEGKNKSVPAFIPLFFREMKTHRA